MMSKMEIMDRKNIGLEDWFPYLGPYPLKDRFGMGVDCVTLRISLRKGRYVGNLQCDRIRK